jgi:hypothetical protein
MKSEKPKEPKSRAKRDRSTPEPPDSEAEEVAREDAGKEGESAPSVGEPGRENLLGALGSGLREVLPGLEILDRDLIFEQGGRADLAGVDAGGRLVLVLVADADPDVAALEVLDTHSLARRHLDTIVRHLCADSSERSIDESLEARTVVIDPVGSERLLLRLAPIFDSGIELFGLYSIQSAAGERSYLAPIAAPPSGSVQRGLPPEAAFLESLPPALEEVGREAVERIGRVDRELLVTGTAGSVSWSFQDEVLVRLEHVGHRLQASVGPHHETRLLESEADLDPLLESVLARFVQWLDYDAPASSRTPGIDLGEGDPILTPEEIDAFRD